MHLGEVDESESEHVTDGVFGAGHPPVLTAPNFVTVERAGTTGGGRVQEVGGDSDLFGFVGCTLHERFELGAVEREVPFDEYDVVADVGEPAVVVAVHDEPVDAVNDVGAVFGDFGGPGTNQSHQRSPNPDVFAP
jgi:hypothetical protein